jgi:hypothetical protein
MVGGVLAFHAVRALARASSTGVCRVCAVGVSIAAVGLVSFGPGCSIAGLSALGDGGTLDLDGNGVDVAIGLLDGGTCQPGDVRTFAAAAYTPATPMWQDVCTTDQLAAFYAACVASDADAAATSCATFQSDPTNMACAACILTPDSAPNYGPLVGHGTFITANVGGCIEVTDPSGLVCAKAQQALSGCELAACEANCPVHDMASRAALDQCTSSAASTGCEMFADQADCALGIAEAGVSTACASASLHDFYYAVVPLFCGSPPPPEGGAPPPDGRAGDAAFGEDATTDGAPGGNDGGATGDGAPSGEASADGGANDASVGDVVTDAAPE